MDKLKVVTIGGGSSYTPELVEGFIKRYSEFPLTELWLVDIEEGKEKLEIVSNLARRMVAKAGLPIKIYDTLDRREALKDADFVTTQLRVGTMKARIKDERIPLSHGVIGQETNGAGGLFKALRTIPVILDIIRDVEETMKARIKDERIPLSHGVIGQETNGAGGLFKALRTIPVILDIIRDVEELCPNAWIINFANPAGIITEAVLNYTSFNRFLGLCNVPINMKFGVADLLKVERDRVEVDFAGLNHMVYGLKAKLDGVDVTEEVVERLAESSMTMQNIKDLPFNADFIRALNHMVYGLKAKLDGVDVTEEVVERLAESSMTMQNIKDLPFNADFIRALGIIPCPYHKYYYKTKDMLESELEEFKEGKVRGQVVEALEADLFELYKDETLDVKPPQLEQRGGAYYSDAACNLISSIYNDKHDIQVVNLFELYKDETLDVKPPQLEQRGGAYYSDAACNLISSIYNDKHDIQVVNTRNNGTIKNFKDNNAIEVSCVITKNGARPMSVGYLPEGISGLVSQIKDFEVLAARAAVNSSYRDALKALCINPLIEVLAARAAVNSSYRDALKALCINPLIPSDDLAKVILDEMLEAHKEHLGDFK